MPARRWLAGVLGALAFALLPWALLLGFELPSRHLSRHWDLAWTGFDVALATTLLAAAIAALRGSPWLERLAIVAGTLLLCDAWFDVLTAWTTTERTVAIVLAFAGELPLAVLCFAISLGHVPSLRMIKAKRGAAEEPLR
jgi:hypothetical protein